MSYDKLSLASFKEALKSNKYVNATGARRAVGKATTLSDADKEKARAAIDAHFGSAPATPAPKKAASKKAAAAKKPAAKKAAAAPKKAAAAKPAPAPKKKAAAAPKQGRKAARAAAPQTEGIPAVAVPGLDLENLGSIATQMRIAEKTIQNVGAALSVITQAKEKYPEADLGTVVEEMGGTLSGAVAIFQQVVNTITRQPAAASSVVHNEPAPAPRPQNGVVNTGVPSRAEALFHESGPGGADQTATG